MNNTTPGCGATNGNRGNPVYTANDVTLATTCARHDGSSSRRLLRSWRRKLLGSVGAWETSRRSEAQLGSLSNSVITAV